MVIRRQHLDFFLFLPVLALLLAACNSPSASPGSMPPNHPPITPPSPAAQGRDPEMEEGAKFMAALVEQKQRLEKNPKDKEALLFLAGANIQIARYPEAQEYYQRYLELDPKHVGARTDLATTYYVQKNYDSAIRELKSVLIQSPRYEPALFNLGLILAKDKGDAQGAIRAWEALLETNPQHAKATEIRQEIEVLKKKS